MSTLPDGVTLRVEEVDGELLLISERRHNNVLWRLAQRLEPWHLNDIRQAMQDDKLWDRNSMRLCH